MDGQNNNTCVDYAKGDTIEMLQDAGTRKRNSERAANAIARAEAEAAAIAAAEAEAETEAEVAIEADAAASHELPDLPEQGVSH